MAQRGMLQLGEHRPGQHQIDSRHQHPGDQLPAWPGPTDRRGLCRGCTGVHQPSQRDGAGQYRGQQRHDPARDNQRVAGVQRPGGDCVEAAFQQQRVPPRLSTPGNHHQQRRQPQQRHRDRGQSSHLFRTQ